MNYQFAHRTDWELSQNKISQVLEDFQLSNIEYLDLTVSNPTKLGFNYPEAEILNAFKTQENLTYYPKTRGLKEARLEVCKYYMEKGLNVEPEQVFLTSSTSEGYSVIFKLLANGGDRVLFPRPSYPLFEFLVGINDLEMGQYSLTYKNDWRCDIASLKKNCDRDTKAIVMVNPNNPTGSYVRQSDLKAINDFIKNKNIALISDEVFLDYLFEKKDEGPSLVNNRENLTFVLGGLSKALGLPQMKLSWIVINGPKGVVQEATKRLDVIMDTYLSVNAPSQNALKIWMQSKDVIQQSISDRLKSNLKVIQELTNNSSIECLRLDGGWYAVLKMPDGKKEEDIVLDLLSEEKVFVHPGYFFDFEQESFLIISLLSLPEALKLGVKKIVSKYSDVIQS